MAASSATDVNRTRLRARDKSATRLAILDAARKVMAENGAEKLTLADVAVEAAMARGTVYGYFRSREELLQAVLADDLTEIANTMSGLKTAVPEPEPDVSEVAEPGETAQILSMPAFPIEEAPPAFVAVTHAVEPSPASEEADPLLAFALPAEDAGESDTAAAPPAEEAADPVVAAALEALVAEQPKIATVTEPPVIKGVIRPSLADQKSQLDEILSKLVPNDPENSEGSAAALNRFDRRLRVIERALTDVQSVQARTEKMSSTSADSLAENIRGLSQRLEESERRQREAFADLRASAREAARRLETLEAAKIAPMPVPADAVATPSVPGPAPDEGAPSQEQPASLHEETVVLPAADVSCEGGSAENRTAEVPEPGVAPEPAAAVAAPAPEQSEENAETAAPKVTYLAAARLSARTAAAAASTTTDRKPRSWLFRVPRKYLMLTCGVMSVLVFVISVLVVQRMSAIAAHADTMNAAVVQRTLSRAAAPRQRVAAVAPLDALSALAERGDSKAQLIIGVDYLKGFDGIPKNPVAAAQWIARSAKRGEPMAQYWAGYIYQHGIGVSADPDEAIRWYEASADQGNTKAMYNLGVGYAQGWTGARDVPQAAQWFARAARLGYLDAQFNLAVLYERGQGVPASLSDAYKWYAVAAAQGDVESKKRLTAIGAQMDPDDLEAAQRAAASFSPTPVVREANTMPAVAQTRS